MWEREVRWVKYCVREVGVWERRVWRVGLFWRDPKEGGFLVSLVVCIRERGRDVPGRKSIGCG